ncbi:MAG: ABC transporter permease [Planctomycetes bacterium]|nr:ABC transporter permease [Planctomycetota bacterium]
MPTRSTRRGPVAALDIAFAAMLGIYIFFIAGIIVANLLLVVGTPLGRVQFIESIRDRQVLQAVWLSVWTSTVAAIVSLVVSVPVGYVLSRWRFRGVQVLDALVDIPIVLPPLLFGISLLVLFQRTFVGPVIRAIGMKFVHEPAGIVLVQVLIATAYGARMMKGTFDGLDPRLAAVAQTLGCTRARAFFTVTLPTVRNSIVAALVMIWARALALYGPIIAFVGSTAGYTEVMPTRMYLEMSVGRLEAALAISLMMIAMAAVVLLIVKLAGGAGGREVERMTRV